MMKRLVPNPLLTVALAAVWLLLLNDFSVGALVLGLILGLLMPHFTRRFWPDAPRLFRPVKLVNYVLVVIWDIIIANIQVAYLILFRRNEDLRSTFITVPLDVTAPEAIAVLGGTITMTPGTVSADVAADQRSLLVHCLDTGDPEATVQGIKQRYEARLREIFE